MLVSFPTLRPTGTLTRRCSDPLWLTAAAPSPTVAGSEILTMIQAPPGWLFVGADVDAQELKIFSYLCDWWQGEGWGATPFSRAHLLGDKDQGTDLHSVTANGLGVDRQVGKVINFLMAYLGGVNALTAKIVSETGWTAPKAEAIAKAAIQLKRGRKLRSGLYSGGTDAAGYNAMLAIADGAPPPFHGANLRHAIPQAPFSKARMPFPLRKSVCRGDYTPSRANWVIQTTGADMRDFVVCKVNQRAPYARLVITRHDEYWFAMREGDVERFIPVFQQIHWDFWQGLADVFDLGEIPEAYRWFSEINVDTVIRKSPKSVDTPTRVCKNINTGHVRKP